MTNVVDMMRQLADGLCRLAEGDPRRHGPSGYYGFRIMNQFDEDDKILEPTPADAIKYVGHRVDHSWSDVEVDYAARLTRMRNGEPRPIHPDDGWCRTRREPFKAIIDHCRPMIERDDSPFSWIGDHADNWDWLKGQARPGGRIGDRASHVGRHPGASPVISGTAEAHGLRVFIFDNTFHGVYADQLPPCASATS